MKSLYCIKGNPTILDRHKAISYDPFGQEIVICRAPRVAAIQSVTEHVRHHDSVALFESALPIVGRSELVLCTTHTCNAHCEYCSVDSPRALTRFMSTDLAIAATEELLNFRTLTVLRILATGGEPSLNLSVVSAAIDRARELGVPAKTVLSTNGKLRAGSKEVILRYKMTLQLSLDSCERQTNDRLRRDLFQSAVDCMAWAEEKGIALIVRCAVTRYNVTDMAKLVDFCGSFGVKLLEFQPLRTDTGRGKGLQKLRPPISAYVTGLFAAKDRGEKRDVAVRDALLDKHLKGARRNLSTFSVMPDGNVVLSTIVDEQESSDLIAARWIGKGKGFEYFQENIDHVGARFLRNTLTNCRSCFASSVCRGLANYHLFKSREAKPDAYYCALIRRLLEEYIVRKAEPVAGAAEWKTNDHVSCRYIRETQRV